jgi:transcriptional regulator with XRE-family HTH domain
MPETFGARLVRFREARGWTQAELAQRACIPRPTMNALEHGRRGGGGLALRTALHLARTFEVGLDELIGYVPGTTQPSDLEQSFSK